MTNSSSRVNKKHEKFELLAAKSIYRSKDEYFLYPPLVRIDTSTHTGIESN